jgi:TRAP-type mannitol/chloroaromatic compound transport system permease small subunit
MGGLLAVSRVIDGLNERIGKLVAWLVLVAVLISAGNAVTRKLFSLSSNAWLELQWYLFGAVFMLGAAWTMKTNEHVRVDVLSSRLRKPTRDRIEVFGLIVFFAPFVLIHLYYSTPFFITSYTSGEFSTNAGGLIVWPAKGLVMLGFLLLTLQGVSELIKRIAIIRGELDDVHAPAHASAEVERLKQEIAHEAVAAPGPKGGASGPPGSP